ncbi:MAG: mucoidy inhibitor MuiA family protein [Candidatus Omnitrophota bacterium]
MRIMLKMAFLFVALWFLPLVETQAASVAASSRVSSVMIYQQSARITRQASVPLKAGEQSIILEDILSEFDENSLTVAGQGEAKVRIYGASLKREYLQKTADPRVAEIQQKMVAIEDEAALLHNEVKVIDRKDKYLSSINLYAGNELPKQLVSQMPTREYLSGIYDFLSVSSVQIESRREELRLKERELLKGKEVLQRQLADLQSAPAAKVKRSIVVDVACDQPGEFVLEVSYLVGGASWRPVYDARTQYARSEITLALFGVISNGTGEDWDNVTLTLSTVDPTLGGRMPYVEPLLLNAVSFSPNELVGGMARKRATLSQYNSMALDAAPTVMESEEKVRRDVSKAVAQTANAAQKGISVVYTIARPVSIKSDGVEARFPVVSQDLKADFKYSIYPRAVTHAFLGSRVTNDKGLQLLAGEVSLFLEGDYIGKSTIDAVGPGEEFDLYLGIDENIKVKREQLSRKVDDVMLMGISSPNIEVKLERKLTVENNKAQKSRIILFEAMPVSQNDRIKVRINSVTVEPNDKDWKERKGVWRWEFELGPNEKKEIIYSLSVAYPREMNVGDF